jgi:TP901 family phage tail tape measure protein
MSELVVQTAFTAKDTTSAILLRQANAAQTFGARLKTAFKTATKESSVLKSVFSANLLSNAVSRMASGVARGLRTAVDEFIDFDAAIRAAADAGAIELQPGTVAFKEFEQAARDLATTTKYSAAGAAEAMEKLGLAGFDAQQAIAALPYVAQLATASGLELADAADVASSAMTAFGMATDDSAQLALNMARVNDILAMSADTSKMSTEDFTSAMKTSGAALSGVGMSLETYTALLGKLTQSGMEGADAGSKLNFMMKGLAAPSKAAQKATASLGISMYDEAGNMRDLIDFIADYEKATADQTEAQRNANTSIIFGKRGLDGVNAVLALGADGLKTYRDELGKAGGTAQKEAGVIEKSLGYKLDILKNSAIEMGFQFLESFGGEGKNAIDELIKSVREFDMKPIVEAAKTLLDVFKWLFRMLRDHQGTLKVIVAMFAAWKLTMMAMGIQKFISGLRGIESAATAAAGATAGIAAPKGGAAAPGAGAGAVGAVGAVAQAAGLGYAIGTFFEETFFNPMRLAGEKMEISLGNLASKMGTKDVNAMSQADLAKSMQTIQSKAKQSIAESPISSIEGAVAHVNSGLMGMSAKVGEFFGFLSADEAAYIVEQNKGPIDVQREQLEELGRIYHEMALAVLRAKLEIDSAAKAATTEINVNVANAPAGTTVDAKGSKGAPKVNQGQAGKV